ncbi:hypothetical protein WR25_19001 [Diploscapter pachys]|uniref:DNA methyltransferase 1-associated 1 domain-containing protein n=1 Tax=Diploscapter pachys TaxID=2018661 RepID=A0A2A2KG15_9BILA|nr:hypothetical protein WR25_19001 [Diploscapter pachys]
MNPNASDHTCHVYNEFRQLTVHLIDLKATLQSAEFELESIRSKMEEKGMSFEIEPRLRISNLPEGGLDESALTEEQGAPLTVRRITSYIDVTQSVNPLGNIRKRKPPSSLSSSSVEPKKSRNS